MSLDLYIGNKNYSSWSLRPWLLLKHLGIPFTEHMVSVAGRDYNPALRPIAGNARVPCLHVDGFQIWESLAIAEYLAEQYPALWPADPKARARARSISAEMHAGFANLRKAMPMNLKFRLRGKPADAAVQRDIDRIVELWTEARTRFATPDGPYLFGDFSVADGMYAGCLALPYLQRAAAARGGGLPGYAAGPPRHAGMVRGGASGNRSACALRRSGRGVRRGSLECY